MSALGNTMNPALKRLGEVSVRLSVELGRTDMALKDVLALGEGSVVALDRLTDELLDITANGQVIAYGEVIAQNGKFALRIVSLAGGDDASSGPPRSAPPSAPTSAPRPAASSGPKPDVPTPGDIPSPQGETMVPDAPAPEMPAQPQGEAGGKPAPQGDDAPGDAPGDAPTDTPADAPAEEVGVDALLDALDELDDLPEAPSSEEPPAEGDGK